MAIQQRPINRQPASNDGRPRPGSAAFFTAVLVSLFALAVAACGGGGGGGGGSSQTSSGTSGYVAKGPVSGATVSLHSIAVDGTKTLLGTAVTDGTGAYQINVTPPPGTVLLVEAAGGTYLDEVGQQPIALAGNFRAVGVANGAPMRMSLSPFSEAVVAEIAATAPGDWSAARVQTTNAAMSDWVGVANLLDFRPVSFLGASAQQNAAEASDDDFVMSLQLGGFSGFLHRLGSPAPVTQGVGVLRTVVADPDDDRYTTPYLMGILDFIDATEFSADYKRAVKGILVLDNQFATDAQISAALPTGQATGSASAPMPDNAFELLPNFDEQRQSPIKTKFNSRGALIKYQISASNPDLYRELSTGSVGEVFGDGDVGVGRWHGGLVHDVQVATGDEQEFNNQYHAAANGLPYAVAIPATNVPTCGFRSLQLAGSTLPVQPTGQGTKPIAGLTPDSRIAVQYLGASAYIGVDIGLQLSDGSVFHVVSPGGLSEPWYSGITVSPDRTFIINILPPNAPASILRLSGYGMLAGAGARKAAVRFEMYSTIAPREHLAAAFVGPDTPLDAGSCPVMSAGDGSFISPPPTADNYLAVFGVPSGGLQFIETPMPVTFRSSGALRTIAWDPNLPIISIPESTPVFGLAGNADAAIGLANGPFSWSPSSFNVSLPFAVAKPQPAGSYPVTGSRRYRLVSATSPMRVINANGPYRNLAIGQITSASLELNFGEYPIGTPGVGLGSTDIRIEGIISGSTFSIALPFSTSTAFSGSRYLQLSGSFGGDSSNTRFAGFLAGSSFDQAVVAYSYRIGETSFVHGVLLFQAE